MADFHSPLDNNTMQEIVNAVTTVVEDKRTLYISYVLLGVCFASLLCIVGMDMLAKYRSGELRDDVRGLKNCFVFMLKIVPMLFVALFAKIASLASCSQAKPREVDIEAAIDRTRTTQAIVERLAAKASSPGTTLSIGSVGSNLVVGDQEAPTQT